MLDQLPSRTCRSLSSLEGIPLDVVDRAVPHGSQNPAGRDALGMETSAVHADVEEVLILDPRGNLPPSGIVEKKLMGLLGTAGLRANDRSANRWSSE